ncbi:MAG: NusG domain II-containing protein [Clostridia bacterium]|nr:NusG domain II-containing protein [Clostridia bacterium]
MNLKFIKKGDIIMIAVIIIAAAVFMLWNNSKTEAVQAVITVDGEVVKTVDLGNIKEKITFIPATEPRVLITAENGKIRFESAECEDKLCVACGNLSKHGDTAVCLPSKTVITVTGSDVDAVVY